MDDIFYLYFCATPTPPPNLLEKKLLEPGVDKPCFARFKCSRCHHVWGSVWAWKKYGQQCSTCIIALQKLVKDRQRTKREVEKEIKKLPKEHGFDFSEIHYYCCAQCENYWAWEKRVEGMRCKAKIDDLWGQQKICGNLVYAESAKGYIMKYEKAELNPPHFPNTIGQGPHITSLCEYCILGRCKRGVSCALNYLISDL
jgi:hypothetical protein